MDGLLQRLRAQWQEVWATPDPYLVHTGSSAELGLAKVRLAVTASVLALPLATLLLAEPGRRLVHLPAVAVTLFALLLGLVSYELVLRGERRPWLPMVTSLVDVTLVSAVLVGYTFIGDPHRAVNSKVTFEIYFLAIGATCLRYDTRVSAVAGIVAMLEYSAIVGYVALTYDLNSNHYAPWIWGQFFWEDQLSRVLVLAGYTALCSVIVYRLQRHRQLSNNDRLTGLFNRAYFEEFLAAEVRRSKRYGHPFAVAMLDLDRFKLFNDTWGHAAGDEALKLVANTIRQGGRTTDLVARYGGEEIVVVMPETTLAAARQRLEAIRQAVAAQTISIPKREDAVTITVSAGVAEWPEDGNNPEDLLHIADARLFHAKALGRNRIVSTSNAAAAV